MRSRATVVLALVLAALGLAGIPAHADTRIFDIRLGHVPQNTIVECDSVVVTAVGYWGFFIQEPIPDKVYGRMYSGIWVYAGANQTCHKGQIVNVSGTYNEYFGESEIDQTVAGANGWTHYVGPGTVPDPVETRISEINNTGKLGEAYECVFVRVDSLDNSLWSYSPVSNIWQLKTNNDKTGDSLAVFHHSAKVGDDFQYDNFPPLTEFYWVQGIMEYDHSQRKLAPRSCLTDFGFYSYGCKPVLDGAYCTGNTTMNVEFGVGVDSTTANNPANYELASGYSIYTAKRDNKDHTVVHLTTDYLPNANPDQVIVSGVKSEQGLILMDPNETFNFLDGFTSIYQIQYVANPAQNDASPLVGDVCTISGRVTALDGKYCYLQDGDGTAWHGLYSRVSTGSAVVAVGDSVQITGAVAEYNGDTEFDYHTGCDNFQVLGHKRPIVVNTITAHQLPFRGSYTGEPWEGCLVHLTQATILDSIPGIGGPYFHEFPIKQGAYVDTAWVKLNGLGGNLVEYNPCPGNIIDVTGVVYGPFGMYKILPRTGEFGDITPDYNAPGCDDVGGVPGSVAVGVALDQNRPNPFGAATSIRFELPSNGAVNLEIMDVAGRFVRSLASGPLSAGPHAYTWDGRDHAGRPVGAGTYFYRLRSGGKVISRKMVLIP